MWCYYSNQMPGQIKLLCMDIYCSLNFKVDLQYGRFISITENFEFVIINFKKKKLGNYP